MADRSSGCKDIRREDWSCANREYVYGNQIAKDMDTGGRKRGAGKLLSESNPERVGALEAGRVLH